MLLFSVTVIYPQSNWFECNNLNSAAYLNGGTIIAVGGGYTTNLPFGTIFKSTDDGNNWTMDTTIHAALYGVSFSNSNNGTAVGDFGTILRTKDGGETWIPQTSGTSYSLAAVSFSDSIHGTAVSYYGKIIRTTDAGNTWLSQTSGTANWLRGVTFIDVNNGWVVGQNGIILHTTNGGTDWNTQTSGTTHTLYSVSFTNLNNGVISGAVGIVLKTTDGGVTWITQSTGTTNALYDISLFENDWTAVGEWGTIVRNGIIQESETTNRLNGIYSNNSNKCTAVGWFGTVLNTINGGNTWTNKLWTQVSSHHFVYKGRYRNYFVFKPYNYLVLDSLPLMFVLAGSGMTGELMQDVTCMSSVADTSGFIAVYPSPYEDDWDLLSDVEFISNIIDSISARYSVDLSRVYISGISYGGFMTHELGCRLSNRIAAIAPVAGTIQSATISRCNSNAAPPMVYIHGTLDNWVPYSGVAQTLVFWIQRNNATASIDSISIPDTDTTDGCTVMKYLYRNNEGVARVVFYKIINGGHTWPGMNLVMPSLGLIDRDINASQEIWNFVKDFDIVVGISENLQSIPENFSLIQNFPNPFNPSTTFRYSIPQLSKVVIKVYDILGNEIVTLIDEEKTIGTYELTWNAASLPSGVYFYQIKATPDGGQAGSFVQMKKMILLK